MDLEGQIEDDEDEKEGDLSQASNKNIKKIRDETWSFLDGFDYVQVANMWALASAGPRSSKESRNIYHFYVSTHVKDEERKRKITERFEYLTSLEGTKDLDKLIEANK